MLSPQPTSPDVTRRTAVRHLLDDDPASRETLDRLTRLATGALRAPVAQVNIVLDDRQVSLSSRGPTSRWQGRQEVPLGSSYCRHVVDSGNPLVVEDAEEHPLVRENGATLEAGIRAYASVPLTLKDRLTLGTLCVVDFEPRSWTEGELELLRDLGDFVVTEIRRRGRAETEMVRLANLVDSANDAIFSFELDGTVTTWNPGAERIFGLSRSEVLGESVRTVLPPRHRERVHLLMERLSAGRTVEWEEGHLDGNGDDVRLAVACSPLTDLTERVTGAAVVVQDVTARTNAEADLRRSEARFRSLIENASDIITILSEDGSIVYESPAVRSVLGYEPRELEGRPVTEFVHPDDVPAIEEGFRRLVESPDSRISARFRFRHRTGEWRILEGVGVNLLDDPAVRGIVANTRDITERVETRRALDETEERIHALVENSADLITIVDREGIIRYEAPSVFHVLGHRPEDLIGRDVFDFIHPEDRERMQQRMAAVLAEEGATASAEYRFRDADGGWRVISGEGRNLTGQPGIRGILINARDVTEKRRMESELRQTQKMEAVGRLAGGIAHDFNNLLTVLKGSAGLLLSSDGMDPETVTELREMDATVDRAARLTRQLLTFSRSRPPESRVLELGEVVRDAAALLDRLVGERVGVETRLSDGLRVLADEGQLEQVIVNLAVNARDAMPEGGELRIETRATTVDSGYPGSHGDIEPGRYALLTVADTGSGMSREVQQRIFDPFFSTKPDGKGTGLGLATVWGIVRQAGGTIHLYSEVGRGSVFRIYLPLSEEQAPSPEDEGVEPAGSTATGTVLVVEDEAPVRRVVRRILEAAGHRVVESASGVEALEAVEDLDRSVDLVVTDVIMPEMNGIELVRRLEERWAGLPVVFMSGYTPEAIRDETPDRDGVYFLEKPFEPRTLREIVTRAMTA